MKKRAARQKPIKKKAAKAGATKAGSKKNIAASYNAFKEFEGKRYTGMRIGRSHVWKYDAGEWKETKITPDKWEVNFSVTKRRKGKAPEGSGVPVGTEYHWYILAHQMVKKLNANDYSTTMTGLKYKLAHRRADHDKWNISEKTQRKHLVRILQEFITELELEPEDLRVEETPPVIKLPETGRKRKTTTRTKQQTSRGKIPGLTRLTRAQHNGHALKNRRSKVTRSRADEVLNENEER